MKNEERQKCSLASPHPTMDERTKQALKTSTIEAGLLMEQFDEDEHDLTNPLLTLALHVPSIYSLASSPRSLLERFSRLDRTIDTKRDNNPNLP